MSNGGVQTILTSLRSLRQRSPDRHLFTWVDENGRDERTLTVAQLASAVDGIAAAIRSWALEPGDRVALIYPPGIEFIKAFVGCLAAGVLPVPMYPPDPFRGERGMETFAKIVAASGARAALTNGEYDRARIAGSVAAMVTRNGPSWPRIPWYRTDRRLPRRSDAAAWHEPDSLDDIAFLQFTSGSTASPKGVMVTHANLAHEIAANVVDLRLHDGTRGVFWIPQYHDMGLINVILSTVVGNSSTYLMSPMTFLKRPSVWLDVMSRTRATITSAPNFAYDLAVRKTTPAQRERWDLTALEMAICAAEPVRDKTVREFLSSFAVTGLRPHVFFAAYGLAENTASVTNRGQSLVVLDKDALARGEVALVDGGAGKTAETGDSRATVVYRSCGRSSKPGDRIRIVDPETRLPCPPDRIGEIWVHSSTTTAGYWNLPALTAETFRVRTSAEDGDPIDYLRTGDLGFLLDGELYVTGRLKDLMIIRGRNVHPEDLEDSIRDSHPLIRPGGVLVFSADDGTDTGPHQIVVLVETRSERLSHTEADGIRASVCARVYADHQLGVGTLVIGRVGLAEKTTSGKLRRRVARQKFMDGSLQRSDMVLRIHRGAPDRIPGNAEQDLLEN
jgi:acyl-CoA synthetase (AMP-forming)/AMP-acid ligase II